MCPNGDRIATKFNYFFIGPLLTFPEIFMQIRSEVFVQSCKQTHRQTNKQTDKCISED